jgi:hypothetical protein
MDVAAAIEEMARTVGGEEEDSREHQQNHEITCR